MFSFQGQFVYLTVLKNNKFYVFIIEVSCLVDWREDVEPLIEMWTLGGKANELRQTWRMLG